MFMSHLTAGTDNGDTCPVVVLRIVLRCGAKREAGATPELPPQL